MKRASQYGVSMMDVTAAKKKEALLPLLMYLALNVLLVLMHEPWRDETQSWLLVRELSFGELFSAMSAEGHPCLWFMLLMPFVRLGLPFWSIYILSVGAMLFAGYLFLMRSPFSRPVTCLCFFSALFFYFMPVIARVYAIIPPLLMLLAMAYPKRHERPYRYAALLALLCQTHVVMCGLIGALMLGWLLERVFRLRKGDGCLRDLLLPVLIMLSGVALLFFTLWHSLTDNAIVQVRQIAFGKPLLMELWRQFNELFINLNSIDLYPASTQQLLVLLPLAAIAVYALALWLRHSWKLAVYCLAAIAWHIVINTFLYSTSVQRSLIAIWELLFCVMISVHELTQGKVDSGSKALSRERLVSVLSAVMAAVCVTTLPLLFGEMRKDANPKRPYSYGQEAAAYISGELPQDALILLETENRMTSVTAWLDNGKCYNLLRDNQHTFTVLDRGFVNFAPEGDLDASLERVKQQHGDRPMYLLTTSDAEERIAALDAKSARTLTLVRAWTGSNLTNENYILYQIQ